jgi:hypothetical protein
MTPLGQREHHWLKAAIDQAEKWLEVSTRPTIVTNY